MREVYLDNAATTAPYPDVIEAMKESLKEYGNPSSLHPVGERAYRLIENSREIIAKTLRCDPGEIYFTSGGTESDNWAIRGVAEANKHKGRHIITTAIEHKAVLKSCEYLSGIGYKISYVPVDEMGRVDPEEIQKYIRDDTILVSVMTGNNEIGTVQPIAAIGKICRDKGILLHTDAVQMYGQFKLSVKDMYVDLLSASGHKFHGPKGTGFLYVRDGVAINNLIFGGGQEDGRRAGTENVVGIVGMGKAAEISNERLCSGEVMPLLTVRDYMIESIMKRIPDAKLNGSLISRLPNNVSFTFPGLNASQAVIALAGMGVYVSAGSACNNGDPAPSHVLLAIGRTEEEASQTLRFTLNYDTTMEDIDFAVDMLVNVVELLTK